ncbi:putative cytochrome P450 superfamily [Helianthus anomalus]
MSLMMEKIRRANGSTINLSEMLISLTNNVVCKVALGRTYEDREFKNLLERTMELLGSFSVGSYIPSLKWMDRLSGLERKANKLLMNLMSFLRVLSMNM